MPNLSPVTFLDARYGEENAQATPWPDAVAQLERAGLFWVSSVRTDGRPHVTPVVAVWMDGDDWAFEVADDGTFGGHGTSLVYQLIPVQALGFRKGPFSHTRWDFTA